MNGLGSRQGDTRQAAPAAAGSIPGPCPEARAGRGGRPSGPSRKPGWSFISTCQLAVKLYEPPEQVRPFGHFASAGAPLDIKLLLGYAENLSGFRHACDRGGMILR